MNTSVDVQSIVDAEHLGLIRLGYFISAGMACFYLAFGLLYAVMGIFFGVFASHVPPNPRQQAPPEFIGWFLALFGLAFAGVGGVVGAMRLRAARWGRERRSLWLCRLVAAISCLEIPYGTAFGVLALMVLARPSVIALFDDVKAPQD